MVALGPESRTHRPPPQCCVLLMWEYADGKMGSALLRFVAQAEEEVMSLHFARETMELAHPSQESIESVVLLMVSRWRELFALGMGEKSSRWTLECGPLQLCEKNSKSVALELLLWPRNNFYSFHQRCRLLNRCASQERKMVSQDLILAWLVIMLVRLKQALETHPVLSG